MNPATSEVDSLTQNAVEFSPSAHVQADFYAKLFRLESDILAGKNPRFKLLKSSLNNVAHAINGVSSTTAPITSLPALPNGTQLPPKPVSKPSEPLFTEQSANPSPAAPRPAQVQSPYGPRPISSQIDPVLLTKSDDLVRAERSLKRKRIEAALREKLEVKEKAPRVRDKDTYVFDGPHLLDGTRVLESALQIVKPVSGLQPVNADTNSRESSFDENDYYSSKVPSWSSEEEGEYRPPDAPKALKALEGLNTRVGSKVVQLGFQSPQKNLGKVVKANQTISIEAEPHQKPDTVPDSQADKATAATPLERFPGVIQPVPHFPLSNMEHADAIEQAGHVRPSPTEIEDLREESYSPPGIDQLPDLPSHDTAQESSTAETRTYGLPGTALAPREVPRSRDSESYSPPAVAIPVARNHIPTPLAPQPARVSPLAMNRLPQTGYVGQSVQSDTHSSSYPVQMLAQKQPIEHQPFPMPYNIPPPQLDQQSSHAQMNVPPATIQPPPGPAQNRHQPHASGRKNKKQRGNGGNNGNIGGANGIELSRNATSAQIAPVQNPRKRRRAAELLASDPAPKRAARPVEYAQEPRIKEEPISPVPFADAPYSAPQREAPRRLVLREDGRAEIEAYSPLGSPVPAIPPRRESNGSVVYRRNGAIPNPVYVDDIPSPRYHSQTLRDTARRIDHENHDLRRVASLQYSSRQYSPESRGVRAYSPEEIQYIRAPSRFEAERAPSQQKVQYEQPGLRYRTEPNSPMYQYRDENLMEPPRAPIPRPQRVVVDQYGNEYIAIAAASAPRQSAVRDVPSEDIRHRYTTSSHVDPYLNIRPQSVLGRQSSMRPSTRVIEIDDDDDYRRMPPPPPLSAPRKRIIEVLDEPARRPPVYQPNSMSRAASLQPLALREEYMPLSPASRRNPEEVAHRAYSMRPGSVQQVRSYHEQTEYDPREPSYRRW